MIKLTVWDHILMTMVLSMLERYSLIIRVSGLMIGNMEEEWRNGQMEQSMKEIINVVRNMGMVNLYLLMDLIIKVIQ